MAARPQLLFEDATLQDYYNSSTVHGGVAFDPGEGSTPSLSQSLVTVNVFWSSVAVGFRHNLSSLLTEYCNLAVIAPSQLTLRSWGLIHSLQVLSDISGFRFTGQMIMRAFRLTGVADSPRRFDLTLREGRQSPVDLPLWIGSDVNYPDFFFFIHQGLNQTEHRWSPPGFVPRDMVSAESFPADSLDLPERLRDSRFLLHPLVVDRSSLNDSPDAPVIPFESLGRLTAARMAYDSHLNLGMVLVLSFDSSDGDSDDKSSPDGDSNSSDMGLFVRPRRNGLSSSNGASSSCFSTPLGTSHGGEASGTREDVSVVRSIGSGRLRGTAAGLCPTSPYSIPQREPRSSRNVRPRRSS